MNLALWLDRHARSDPARTAVFVGAAPWKSFGALAADVAGLARGMREKLGLAPGDRVAIVMRNAPQYAEVMLAAWWAGLAAVPVNAKLHPREVAFILEDSGAKAVFATPDWVAGLAEAVAGMPRAPDVIEAGSVGYDALLIEPMPLAPVADDALAWLF
ncbi:MAG TPA: AMP-binding protein, partial [Usitatibacteraceae bacterium]|nr:AMP-binding protein [Usitatibacteraceae bacterium]